MDRDLVGDASADQQRKEDGSGLTNQICRDAMIRTCKKAGLREIQWRTLRHSFASHLVMLGGSLKEIQELLSHGTLEMTMRYAQLSPDVKREAVRALDGPERTREDSGAKAGE